MDLLFFNNRKPRKSIKTRRHVLKRHVARVWGPERVQGLTEVDAPQTSALAASVT